MKKVFVVMILFSMVVVAGVVSARDFSFPASITIQKGTIALYIARMPVMTVPDSGESRMEMESFKNSLNSLWRKGFHLRYIRLVRNGIKYKESYILRVRKEWALFHKSELKWLVLRWGNNLYKAFSVLQAGFSRGGRYYRQVGLASWYGSKWTGLRTSSGEKFNHMELTAASRSLPFNSIVVVTDLSTYKSVVVRITDRGPFYKKRIIDLSEGAAYVLGMLRSGVKRVRVEVLLWNDRVGGR